MRKFALVLMFALLCTGCGSKEATTSRRDSVDVGLSKEEADVEFANDKESNKDKSEESPKTEKSAKSEPVTTTEDGYKVYYLSNMTKEEFPNLIGTYDIAGYEMSSLLCYPGPFKLSTDDSCTVESHDYSYIDKIVVNGAEITSENLTYDGLWDLLANLNKTLPLGYANLGLAGSPKMDSVVSEDDIGKTGLSSEFFEQCYPKKMETNQYSRLGIIQLGTDDYDFDAQLEVYWSPDGDIEDVSFYVDVDTDTAMEQDIDMHTVYITINGEKVAVMLDKTSAAMDEYHGIIYIKPE